MTREKIASRGISTLSDAELLALVIGEGRTAQSPRQQAEGLLAAYGGNLARLCREDMARLRMVAGLGLRRAERLMAAAELGRRIRISEGAAVTAIANSDDVRQLFAPVLEGLDHEECWVLFLTSSNRILGRQRVSQGGVQKTVVDHRLIVKRALELLATQMILVHNHPSGSAVPSQEDVLLTRRIASAAELFDIVLLDHVIISREGDFSFRQAQLLE